MSRVRIILMPGKGKPPPSAQALVKEADERYVRCKIGHNPAISV